MLFVIDPTAAEPIFEQLLHQIRAQAMSGKIAKGTRLPAAKDLAETLGINLHTVLHAYRELAAEGVISLGRGRGAVVNIDPLPEAIGKKLENVVAQAKAEGIELNAIISLTKEIWSEK
ncbi:MAG: GntR family transcriptional regulator [Microbacteriaceae bacterium]|nr:GntR family transcriptional regulator [Microbacteriaceae bacterium]